VLRADRRRAGGDGGGGGGWIAGRAAVFEEAEPEVAGPLRAAPTLRGNPILASPSYFAF